MSLNRDLLGKTYSDDAAHVVEASRIHAYAEATNSAKPVYLAEQAVAPPIFAVVVSSEVMMRALTDTELEADLPKLLHGEQWMRFHHPLRAGDKVRASAKVAGFSQKRSGEILDLGVQVVRDDDVLLYEALVTLFIRSKERVATADLLPAIGVERPVAPAVPEQARVLVEASMDVAEDQSLRYAEASGDHNPIHKDDDFARAVGLPGKILHGLCSLAMAQHAIVDAVASGDPARLRVLQCQFARPVLMGDRLTTRGMEIERGERLKLGFEVVNQKGKAVIKSGYAEIGAE